MNKNYTDTKTQMNNIKKTVTCIGLLLIIGAVIFCIMENTPWWLFLTLGLILTFSSTLIDRITAINIKYLLILIIFFMLGGMVTEFVRILPNLWVYTGNYNKLELVVLTIIIAYPLMFIAIISVYSFFNQCIHPAIASLVSVVIIAMSYEGFNFFAQLWFIPESNKELVSFLYIIGYPIQGLIAIAGYCWLLKKSNLNGSISK